MYEQTGRYYAFFGPHATITPEEERFLAYWSNGKHRALDFGAGLCGSAMLLARLGLEVCAFEPSPLLVTLAMDRLNRENDVARSITLLEGRAEGLAEFFEADFILVRSVLMLLSSKEREAALDAVGRTGDSARGATLGSNVIPAQHEVHAAGGRIDARALGGCR